MPPRRSRAVVALIIGILGLATITPLSAAGLETGSNCPTDTGGQGTQCAPFWPATQIASGSYHACILRADGGVQCEGQNIAGEGDDYDGIPATAIALSEWRTCILLATHNVVCRGAQGSLNYTRGDAIAVAASSTHYCVLTVDRNAYCDGKYAGETATAPYLGADAAKVAAGTYFTCILRQRGTVHCYGGQEGYLPPTVLNEGFVVDISVQHFTVCVVWSDGGAKCYWRVSGGHEEVATTWWGNDAMSITASHAGGACVITAEKNVDCWLAGEARDYHGQDAIGASVGWNHDCILHAAGHVRCNRGLIWDYTPTFPAAPVGTNPKRVGSDNTIHAGSQTAVRATAEARIDPVSTTAIGTGVAARISSDIAAAQGGDLLPLANTILDLQTTPPPILTAVHGPAGVIETWSRTDGPRTPGCYGVENHSGAFTQPLQICSPFLP